MSGPAPTTGVIMGTVEGSSMVPRQFFVYFGASSAAAGALIGLLFVAVSLRSDTIFGEQARPSGRAMAGSAFIGLANGFFVSLAALVPTTNVGSVAAGMAVISLVSTVYLHWRLTGSETHRLMLSVSVLFYTAEFVGSLLLAVRPHDMTLVITLAYLVMTTLLVSLVRAWRHMERPSEVRGSGT